MKSSATIKSIVLITTFLTSATVLAQQMKSAKAQSDREFFPMPSTRGTPLPFSEAVRFGKTLYVSGQIGNLPGTLTLAPGGIAAEARQALENIKSILERHDSSMDQVHGGHRPTSRPDPFGTDALKSSLFESLPLRH
jgi:2-iminobutanoate/2-iminopropanoate deaminase